MTGPALFLPFFAAHHPVCHLNNCHTHHTEALFSPAVAVLAAHQASKACANRQVVLPELKSWSRNLVSQHQVSMLLLKQPRAPQCPAGQLLRQVVPRGSRSYQTEAAVRSNGASLRHTLDEQGNHQAWLQATQEHPSP